MNQLFNINVRSVCNSEHNMSCNSEHNMSGNSEHNLSQSHCNCFWQWYISVNVTNILEIFGYLSFVKIISFGNIIKTFFVSITKTSKLKF